MEHIFAEVLHRIRTEKEMTQRQLADILHVDRSTIAYWESGRRTPDIDTINRISEDLDIDVSVLLSAASASAGTPVVIAVDDEKPILSDTLSVLNRALPDAQVRGFTKPSEAVAFAKDTPVSLAFLDIEMGRTNGLDLCRTLLDINPRTNVVFLTAFIDYAFRAWDTGACGFLLKPLTEDNVRRQLELLRHPVWGIDQP